MHALRTLSIDIHLRVTSVIPWTERSWFAICRRTRVSFMCVFLYWLDVAGWRHSPPSGSRFCGHQMFSCIPMFVYHVFSSVYWPSNSKGELIAFLLGYRYDRLLLGRIVFVCRDGGTRR